MCAWLGSLRLDAYPDLWYVSDLPWPESWPIRGEDVKFADSAATRKESVGKPPKVALPQMWRRPEAAPFLVTAESANATSSPLIGDDSGHAISDTYHRSD